jgi:hypothetical protein
LCLSAITGLTPSQYATKSQPTLKLVWANGHEKPKRPARRNTFQPDDHKRQSNSSKPSETHADHISAPNTIPGDSNPAEGTPLIHTHSLVQQTFSEGRGAAAAEGAWAPAEAFSSFPVLKSDGNAPPDSDPTAPAVPMAHPNAHIQECYPVGSAADKSVGNRGRKRRAAVDLLPIGDQWDCAGQPVRQYPRSGPSFAAEERAFPDATVSLVAGTTAGF